MSFGGGRHTPGATRWLPLVRWRLALFKYGTSQPGLAWFLARRLTEIDDSSTTIVTASQVIQPSAHWAVSAPTRASWPAHPVLASHLLPSLSTRTLCFELNRERGG